MVFGYSWARLASDYNVLEGGFLAIGFMVVLTAPLLAARLKGV
jgi:hypothetical protein